MKVTVFILIKCCVFLLIKGQAPEDSQQLCRTDFRYYDGLHDWIPYANDTSVGVRGDVKWQVLLDQYDYQNILGTSGIPAGVWTARDVDGDGNQMTQSGSVCTNSLRIRNTYTNPNSNNWVFTQAVSYLDAVEVIVNATVRFSGCIQRNGLTPPCQNNFVNLHRYDTDSQGTQSLATINYQPYLGDLTASRLGSEVEESVTVINSFPRPNSALTYFGIQDVGSYGDIQRIIVYYRVAQGYEQGLVICPNVALPKEGSDSTNSGNCACKSNATAITSPERKCNDAGVCEENLMCACNKGYQYNQTLKVCDACTVGMYKPDVSNTSCRPCPVNSTAENRASDFCECIRGTIRDPERPNDVCQDFATFLSNRPRSTKLNEGEVVAITFFVTLILTAIITALVVLSIMWFVCIRNK